MSKLAIYSAAGPYAIDITVQSRNGDTHSLLARLGHTAFEDRLKQLLREGLDQWWKELLAAEAASAKTVSEPT